MRRTKEDMLKTRQQILEAGLDCFSEKGFEATSLVEVASRAGVTRGAIYWHFENKLDLYRATVEYTLDKGDIADYFKEMPQDQSVESRIQSVFWDALGDNKYVDFVFKTLAYTNGREEFTDIFEKLVDAKRRLLKALEVELSVSARLSNADCDPEHEAKKVYLMFEGLFLTKNVPIGMKLTHDEINRIVHSVLQDVL